MKEQRERRGGRPRKPIEERQSVRLWLSATEDEADRVFRASLRAGETVSEYLRRRLAEVLAAEA